MRRPAEALRIERWLVVYLAVITGEDSDAIELDVPLARFDLDSVDAVEMAAQFEKAFACEVGAEFFLQSASSIRDLVPRLAAAAEGRKG